MHLSSVRKIWISLFSIFCLLASSSVYSTAMMPADMHASAAMIQTSIHCDMHSMENKAMSGHLSMQHNQSSHCADASGSLSNCCASACSMISAIITSDTSKSLLSAGRALQLSTDILIAINQPTSTLYRPPIL